MVERDQLDCLNDRGRDRMVLGLRAGDPNDEVLGAWLTKDGVRDVYLATTVADAAVLLDKTIAGCLTGDVPEIVALGKTLKRWRPEILARHTTGASNGPTDSPDGRGLRTARLPGGRPAPIHPATASADTGGG